MLRRIKDVIIRTIPIIFVIIVTIMASEMLYNNMTEDETQKSWDELKNTTSDVSKEVTLRFEDNMAVLDLAADGIALNEFNENELRTYLAAIKEKTFFKRVDVILPNGSVLVQGGSYNRKEVLMLIEQIEKNGAHLSTRMTDQRTGDEVLCYYVPVYVGGELKGILVGAVDCKQLNNIYKTTHYDGEANIFLIDTRDGKFIIDNWHDELSDLYSITQMNVHEDYKGINFNEEVMYRREGECAFISDLNKQLSYIYYMPTENMPFTVAVMVQEESLFGNVYKLTDTLYVVGVIEILVLLIVFVYNLIVVTRLESNRQKLVEAELEKDKTEAKSRFLSSVSHDLRTPLNGIIGMLEVIRLRGEIPEHIMDPLHKIDVSAKHLMSLAGDVLDYNAIDTGKVVFTKDSVNLKQMLNDINIVMEPRVKEKNLSYITNCDNLHEPTIIGSEVHINKILANIISNSIKYNKEKGELYISIEDKPIDAANSEYKFIIKDSGIGMTEEFQKTMFEAFEQENAGARTGSLGHGLGLSIVKRLVESMHGKIEVRSKKDEGTTFIITMPFEVDRHADIEEEELHPERIISQAKILVAEDNELNMEIAEAMLSSCGVVITRAENGKQAVETFENSAPFFFDAILMDIMMPEMDGLDATRAIRALPREDAKSIPIIAMTANTFTEDIKRCKDAGMNEHIAKPLDMDVMFNKIAKTIEADSNK